MENHHQNPVFWARIRYIVYKILSDPSYTSPKKYFIKYDMSDINTYNLYKKNNWDIIQDKNYIISIKKMLCLKKEQLTKNI